MMKFIALLLAIITLTPAAIAEKPDYTSEREISFFFNKGWDISLERAIAMLQEDCPDIQIDEIDTTTKWGFFDPMHKSARYTESPAADIVQVTFKPDKNTGFLYADLDGTTDSSVKLRFLQNENVGLFEVEVSCVTVDGSATYDTYLSQKDEYLSKLYGRTPYEASMTSSYYAGIFQCECALWIGPYDGVDDTAVYLVYGKYLNGPLEGYEILRMCFGNTRANAVIEALNAETHETE